jgi:hypothetical protein
MKHNIKRGEISMLKKIFTTLMAIIIAAAPILSAAEIIAIEAPVPVMEHSVEYIEPVYGDSQSQSSEEELTQAILNYKKAFGGTDEYDEFYHYISDYNGVKVYELRWKNTKNNTSIYANVGTDGIIYSYSYYNDSESNKELPIPTIYKDEALETAYNFIKTNFPDMIATISKDYANVYLNSYQNSYSITFYRVYDDLTINNEMVTITIDYDKKITSFYRYSFSNNVTLPEKPKLLEKDKIISVFNKQIPLELTYRTVYPNGYGGKAEVKLYYKPNPDSYSNIVNAETGEVLIVENSDMLNNIRPLVVEEEAAPAMSEAQAGGLTPEEISAVELQKSFVTVDEITKALDDMDGIDFNGYTTLNSYLYKTKSIYTNKETYTWRITYNNINSNISVTVNAETGEFTSYNKYDYNYYADPTRTVPNYTQVEAAEKATEFLKEYYADKFDEFVINENKPLEITPYTSYNTIPTTYYVNYNRHVNGIKFTDMMSVSLNADTLEINSFSVTYSDAKFPSLDKAMSVEKAAEKYWDYYNLTPGYLPYEYIKDSVIYKSQNIHSSTEKQLLAIYTYRDDGKYIDAVTGKVVNSYDGKEAERMPRTYYVSKAFNDIEGHKYENEIYILTQMDIINSDNEKFEPDSYIVPDEFARWIPSVRSGSGKFDTDTITREKAIKELVARAGYAEIAELKGIFDLSYFSDSDKIDENLKGYIAIAKGMGLLDTFGAKLSPTLKLTKGEAAYLIYSYIIYNYYR